MTNAYEIVLPPKCSERVPDRERSAWGNFYECSKWATVQRDGKWYCGTHDPEKVKARRAKAESAYTSERNEQDRIYADAKALAQRIGVGVPYYERSFSSARGASGYRRSLILTFDEIEKLLAADTGKDT